MSHTCHAVNCTAEIPPKLFMCAKHWKMVPKKLQVNVWNEYRPGQEVDKRPSLAYLAVQQFAVGEVAAQEGLAAEAMEAYSRALKFAEAMKAAGEDLKVPT